MRVEGRGRARRSRAGGSDTLRGPVRVGLPAAVLLLPLLAACASGDGPPTAGEPLPEGVDTAVRGMRTFVTRDGVRRAVVEADTAEWREDNVIHLRRMTMTFFDPNGRESTEVTAEFGIFHQLTGDLEAERQVVVEDRVDDQRLETERLRYGNLDGRLYGDTAFRFMRSIDGLALEGTGFESDPALDSLVLLNQEGEQLPVAAFSEAVPLPAVPAGDPAAAAGEPVAGEEVAGEPVPGDTAAARVDAAAAAPDSLGAPPDTAAAVVAPDSLEAPPDTAAAVPPDSLEAPPDTIAAARR